MEKIKKIIVDACKKAGLKREKIQAVTEKAEKDYHHEGMYQAFFGMMAYGDALPVVEYLKQSEDVYVLDAYAPMYVKIALKSDFPKNPFMQE